MNGKWMQVSIQLGIVLVASGAVSASLVDANSVTSPNLIIFIADDLGWADVGYHGSVIKTPTIDYLAETGVQLDRFYTWPTCRPSRLGLLTGRSPQRAGVTAPVKGKTTWPALEEHFLGQTLRAHGYQTWLCGKWHLGGDRDPEFRPYARSFDHFYGYLGGEIDSYEHTGPNGQLDWYRNQTPIEENGYSSFLLAE